MKPAGAAGAGKYKAGSHRGMVFASCLVSYARGIGGQYAAGGSIDILPEAARRDPRYQQLLGLTSAAQRNRSNELHHQPSGASKNAHIDLTYTTALTPSAPLAKIGISETVSTRTPREPYLFLAGDFNSNALSYDLNLEMAWQAWDEIAGELEPSLDFWDMGGL